MSPPIVHIIASCSDRKRLPTPTSLHIRAVRQQHPRDLCQAWWNALEKDGSPAVPAIDLYCGDHWTIARDLPRVAATVGFAPHLWVASAGYGLVPAGAALRSYGATFASRHADSVVEENGNASRWWNALSSLAGPVRTAPRSLAALASDGMKLLVVASSRYVAAMATDLLKAATVLSSPDDLLIVTGDPRSLPEGLHRNCVPSVASLQAMVGGSRLSLHARVARYLLQSAKEHHLVARAARSAILARIQTAPALIEYKRAALSDDEVRRFVAEELQKNPSATHTRLLRELRGSGRACEQGRFKQLFTEVKAG